MKNNLNDYLIDNNGQNKIENNTWLRSHGGNKNLKYNNSKFNITPENIGNLKLKWKIQTIHVCTTSARWLSLFYMISSCYIYLYIYIDIILLLFVFLLFYL